MLQSFALFLIKGYQKVKQWLYPYKTCVFEPTCSQYTYQAIKTFGVFRGVFMGLHRVLRCHPWQKSPGWDPVPQPKDKIRAKKK